MHPFEIESHIKPEGAERSEDAGLVRFALPDAVYHRLEELEEELIESDRKETFIDVDPTALKLELPPEVPALRDCKLRLYVKSSDNKGHFHIVGHRASDGALFYSNSIMVAFALA